MNKDDVIKCDEAMMMEANQSNLSLIHVASKFDYIDVGWRNLESRGCVSGGWFIGKLVGYVNQFSRDAKWVEEPFCVHFIF